MESGLIETAVIQSFTHDWITARFLLSHIATILLKFQT